MARRTAPHSDLEVSRNTPSLRTAIESGLRWQADLAGHRGEKRAVMVYQLEAYRYWESQLGRYECEHGPFGENFTVDGRPDR